jgi:chromosome partitioning protein
MRTIAIGNQKGGVGKTTTALNLAFALSDRGKRVLLVDLDPQSSLTDALGIEACEGCSISEVMLGSLKLAGILHEIRSGLAIAPADIALFETANVMISRLGREYIIKQALATVDRQFDYALLDLPPTLDMMTINGLAAAQSVLIPTIPQYLDLRALSIFIRTIEKVRTAINPCLTILGILPTFYDKRLKLHRDVLESLRGTALPLLDIRIKRSIRIAESPVTGLPVAALSPVHGEAYSRLAEVIDHR